MLAWVGRTALNFLYYLMLYASKNNIYSAFVQILLKYKIKNMCLAEFIIVFHNVTTSE